MAAEGVTGVVLRAMPLRESDRARFAKYFHAMLDQGVYLAPSQFEAGFLSTAHTSGDIEKTVKAAAKAMWLTIAA